MVTAISFDSDVGDDARRQQIYAGHVLVFAPSPSTLAFAEFARGLVEEAFAPLDPVEAQFSLPVENFVEIVAPLVPRRVVLVLLGPAYRQHIAEKAVWRVGRVWVRLAHLEPAALAVRSLRLRGASTNLCESCFDRAETVVSWYAASHTGDSSKMREICET